MAEFDIYAKLSGKVTIEGDTWTSDDVNLMIFKDKNAIAYFKIDSIEGFVMMEKGERNNDK